MKYKFIVENGIYYIVENPDMVVVGSGERAILPDEPARFANDKLKTGKRVAGWKDPDAVPFGFFKGKCYFGNPSSTHASIKNEDGVSFDSRKSFKYPGRLWIHKKIISFWGYPPFSQLKGVLAEIEREWNKNNRQKISLIDWKFDIPRTNDPDESVEGLRSSKIFRDVLNWDQSVGTYVYDTTLLYSVKTILSDKPLRGVGKPWKEKGKTIDTDRGQEHMVSPMLKKAALNKMTEKEKIEMFNYLKKKNRMAPDEERLYKFIQRRNEDIKKFGKIIETPDVIYAGNGIDSSNHRQVAIWFDGQTYAFGYKNGKISLSIEGGTHYNIGGRASLKYPGRIWANKKVISFWVYPPKNTLKKIISDLNVAFNTYNYNQKGAIDDVNGFCRAEDAGFKLKIDGSWRIDIPLIRSKDSDTYDKLVNRSNVNSGTEGDFYSEKSYLYSLNTILNGSGKLKGIGSNYRSNSNSEINLDKGQEHMVSPMLKKNALNKMSSSQKKEMYNYFKAKGRLSPDEERMYKMIQRRNEDLERLNRLLESPDVIYVAHGEADYDNRQKVAFWREGQTYAFGYGHHGEMKISIEGDKHSDIGKRSSLKYPGRIWANKKIISFWVYPPKSMLRKIMNDLNVTFNTLNLNREGDEDDFDGFCRGDDAGFRLKIDGSWRMDIPLIKASDDPWTYDRLVKRSIVNSNTEGEYYASKSYLYSLNTILNGNAPLKGIGSHYRGDSKGDINLDSGKEHMVSPLLKGKALEKMSVKEKAGMFNYLKNKHQMSPDERRLYAMIQRNLRREGIEFYQKRDKKLFTYDRNLGIMRRTLL